MCFSEACAAELHDEPGTLDTPSAELVKRHGSAAGEEGLLVGSSPALADGGGAALVIKDRKFEVVSMCTMFFGCVSRVRGWGVGWGMLTRLCVRFWLARRAGRDTVRRAGWGT